MQYRKFGKLGINVSALGFGCMRLPVLNNDEAQIDEPQAINIIRHAIDKGVNYIDTAYPYHRKNSELLVGKALKDGYREKVYLATKLPVWLVKDESDMMKYLDEQLRKLQTNQIDMYLIHSLNKENWERAKKYNVFKFIEEAKKSGKIKYIGFSFHDNIDLFKEIIDSYDWDFCQMQYNYMDEKHQAGTEGLKYAASKNMGVVIMEPLRGGKLVKNLSSKITDEFQNSKIKRSPADWALRWVWNHPEVSVVLSGMGSLDEVNENIKIAEDAYANSMTKEDFEIIKNVKNAFLSLSQIPCTNCKYCMPCPSGVNIPENFSVYNQSFMYNDAEYYKYEYKDLVQEKKDASRCVKCGKCESACPQKLQIRDLLEEVKKCLS